MLEQHLQCVRRPFDSNGPDMWISFSCLLHIVSTESQTSPALSKGNARWHWWWNTCLGLQLKGCFVITNVVLLINLINCISLINHVPMLSHLMVCLFPKVSQRVFMGPLNLYNSKRKLGGISVLIVVCAVHCIHVCAKAHKHMQNMEMVPVCFTINSDTEPLSVRWHLNLPPWWQDPQMT